MYIYHSLPPSLYLSLHVHVQCTSITPSLPPSISLSTYMYMYMYIILTLRMWVGLAPCPRRYWTVLMCPPEQARERTVWSLLAV